MLNLLLFFVAFLGVDMTSVDIFSIALLSFSLIVKLRFIYLLSSVNTVFRGYLDGCIFATK